jgi:hypothetical protein
MTQKRKKKNKCYRAEEKRVNFYSYILAYTLIRENHIKLLYIADTFSVWFSFCFKGIFTY